MHTISNTLRLRCLIYFPNILKKCLLKRLGECIWKHNNNLVFLRFAGWSIFYNNKKKKKTNDRLCHFSKKVQLCRNLTTWNSESIYIFRFISRQLFWKNTNYKRYIINKLQFTSSLYYGSSKMLLLTQARDDPTLMGPFRLFPCGLNLGFTTHAVHVFLQK